MDLGNLDSSWLPLVGTVIGIVGGLLLLLFVFRCFLLRGRGSQPKRDAVLLIGLPGSGKTTLFTLLTSGVLVSTCTSMTANKGYVHYPEVATTPSSCDPEKSSGGDGSGASSHSALLSSENGAENSVEKEKKSKSDAAWIASAKHKKTLLVDHPGHRRLFPSLLLSLRCARHVVLVVDSITVHDDREEGVAAIAELLYSIISSSAFYGVKSVLIACTKRDDISSYSSKAVKKLLEGALTTCIRTRRGELGKVEQVIDGKGVVVGKCAVGGRVGVEKGGGRHHILTLGEDETFSFDSSSLPFSFVDISSMDPKNEIFGEKKAEEGLQQPHHGKDKVDGNKALSSRQMRRVKRQVDVEGFSLLPVLRYLVEQT